MKKIFLLLVIVAIGYSCQKITTERQGGTDCHEYTREYNKDTMELLGRLQGGSINEMFYYRYIKINDTVLFNVCNPTIKFFIEYAHPTNTDNNQMVLTPQYDYDSLPFSSKLLMLVNLETITAQRGGETITFKRNNDVPDLYFDIDSLPAGVVLPSSVQ